MRAVRAVEQESPRLARRVAAFDEEERLGRRRLVHRGAGERRRRAADPAVHDGGVRRLDPDATSERTAIAITPEKELLRAAHDGERILRDQRVPADPAAN